jgi:hypothetical protein
MNNAAIYDAVLAAAGGTSQTAILHAPVGSLPSEFTIAAMAIATAVDAAIPPIVGGPSFSQLNLVHSIATAVLLSRTNMLPSSSVYTSTGTTIAVLYTRLDALLHNVPNVIPPSGLTYGGLYANRPAPGMLGRVYVCADMPFIYVDTGISWIQVIDGVVTVTPPAAGSFTPINVAETTLSAFGDSISVKGGNTDNVQYFKAGNIVPGPTGMWTISVGILDPSFGYLYAGISGSELGIVFGSPSFTSFCAARTNPLYGVTQRTFSAAYAPGVASAANNNAMCQFRRVYWLRIRYNAALYYLEISRDGTSWTTLAYNASLRDVYTAGATSGPINPTTWGIGSGFEYSNPLYGPPLYGVICHLYQSPTG